MIRGGDWSIGTEIPSAYGRAERFRGAELREPPVEVLDERVRTEHIALLAQRKTNDHSAQPEEKLRSGVAPCLEIAQEGLHSRVVLLRNHVLRDRVGVGDRGQR